VKSIPRDWGASASDSHSNGDVVSPADLAGIRRLVWRQGKKPQRPWPETAPFSNGSRRQIAPATFRFRSFGVVSKI